MPGYLSTWNKYLDYSHGLASYLGQRTSVDPQLLRCSADNDARLATLGGYVLATLPTSVSNSEATDSQIRMRDGTIYNPVVSMGVNYSAFSDSHKMSGNNIRACLDESK